MVNRPNIPLLVAKKKKTKLNRGKYSVNYFNHRRQTGFNERNPRCMAATVRTCPVDISDELKELRMSFTDDSLWCLSEFV